MGLSQLVFLFIFGLGWTTFRVTGSLLPLVEGDRETLPPGFGFLALFYLGIDLASMMIQLARIFVGAIPALIGFIGLVSTSQGQLATSGIAVLGILLAVHALERWGTRSP